MKPTVLVIDDQRSERRLVYHTLKSDYRVLEACCRDDALDLAAREDIDVVVLDMHLSPRAETAADGVQLERELRLRHPGLPIIVATADSDLHLASVMSRRGVAAYLLKPVDPTELKRSIARALDSAGSSPPT